MIADNADSVGSAALFVGLNLGESEKWLRSSSGWVQPSDKINPGCEYTTPNKVYIDLSAPVSVWEKIGGYNLFWSIQMDALNRAIGLAREGYSVDITYNVTAQQIKAHLGSENIYGLIYAGHGLEGGNGELYPDNNILVPAKYTQYGINFLRLWACRSGARYPVKSGQYRDTPWQLNVSLAGVFEGYAISLNIYNNSPSNKLVTPGASPRARP
jgi:hypothetical protein